MAKFRRIDHLAIATADLEGAAQVWESTLGLKSEAPYQPPGASLRLARLPVGDAFVQLLTPTSETGPFAQKLRIRGEGLFSLSIEVDDLEAAVAHLRKAGADVSEAREGVWPGTRIARIAPASTHGASIQLIQRS
jgi:methylmalonyl-CoA/ethylmalonyl-CoA epimerase